MRERISGRTLETAGILTGAFLVLDLVALVTFRLSNDVTDVDGKALMTLNCQFKCRVLHAVEHRIGGAINHDIQPIALPHIHGGRPAVNFVQYQGQTPLPSPMPTDSVKCVDATPQPLQLSLGPRRCVIRPSNPSFVKSATYL